MRLKELRKARRYKQTEIAEMLSCSQGVYSRYENEEREPPFDIIKKLADFYGVTVDFLMGCDEPAEKPKYTEIDLGDAKIKTAAPDPRAEAKDILQSISDEQYQAALQYLKFLHSQHK